MNKNKLSVIIITLNEEASLDRCLKSVDGMADEIVIVDSGSTDKTINIAKKYKAKIYFRKFDNMGAQKNYAASKASCKWILALDADEVITGQLAQEIKDTIKSSEFNAYLVPRRNIILGKEIKHTRWSPDKHIWLWGKGYGKWTHGVHSEVKTRGEVGSLKNAKIHYQYKTIAEFLEMLNKYTDSEAEELIFKGVNFSYIKLIYFPLRSFIGRFLYKRGYLDGWRGFMLSYLMAVYRLTTWVKVWEKTKS